VQASYGPFGLRAPGRPDAPRRAGGRRPAVRATGREVAAYVPGYSAENDVAVETFLLRGGEDADYGAEAGA
jgi:hypothetical protein